MHKSTRTYALLAAFMMIGMIALIPVAADGDDHALGANDTATISMLTGDSFSYAPATNLPSTISASGSGLAPSGFLTWNSVTGTLSGTAGAPGTFTVILTATWISGNLQQQTTQTITFNVYAQITVSSATSAAALVGVPFSYTLSFTGPADTAVSSPTVTNANGLSWNAGMTSISGTPVATGITTFAWTLSSATSGQSVNFLLTIATYSDLAITSPATSSGYVGGSYHHTVTTSEAATITADISSISELGVSWSSPSLSGTWSYAAASTTSPFYTDHVITFTASATVSGVPTTVNQTHTIRVFAALEYITLPTIGNVTTSISGTIVNLMADITGAMSAWVDWGDGTTVAVDNPEDLSTGLQHDYAEGGLYMATIGAVNAAGTTQHIVMLATEGIGGGDGGEEPGAEDDGRTSLLFLLMGILMIIIGLILLAGTDHKGLGALLIVIGALVLIQLYVYDFVDVIITYWRD